MTGILMGAETQDSHGKPFVIVVTLPDVSVYDSAMSDSLIPVSCLIKAGFTVSRRIPSQAKEDGFFLNTVPLYRDGGTITMPDGKTIIVIKCAQHSSHPFVFLLLKIQFTAVRHF